MIESTDAFKDRVVRKSREIAATQKTSISVAVLGPGLPSLGNSDTADSRKRKQIREELEKDGHSPFFPEEYVVSDPTSEPLLDQERRLLSSLNVDLVIILHTSNSYGTIAEIADFRGVPEISSKTAILFPIRYYTPDNSLVANTVREYHARMPYTDSQFEVCQIVSECRKWANDRAIGKWPTIAPFRF